MYSIKSLIDKYFLHDSSLLFDDLTLKLQNIESDDINLVYGETYDEYGLTIDSLKYYFFIALLSNSIKINKKIISNVIIGDLHSVKNKIVENKSSLLSQATRKIDFIKKINQIYGLNINPELMSQKFKKIEFKNTLEKVTNFFEKSTNTQEIAKKTVLKNRLSQEESVGFQYTLEEVALIFNYDLKIGPPREIYYDQITDIIKYNLKNKNFTGIYLKPTYPLGVGFDFYLRHPEIEKFGLTPYKAGSNKLQDFRIILEENNIKEKAKKIIESSYISNNSLIPNPVLDIYLTCQMAESYLFKTSLKVDENLINDPAKLKKVTYDKFIKNILEPLNIKN